MDTVQCSGLESTLHSCQRGSTITYCDHSKDAGVRCSREEVVNCSNGDVRLMGGHDDREGRVEICYNKTWGTVCHDDWDYRDASVVCYQLGYSGKTGYNNIFSSYLSLLISLSYLY